MPWDINLRGNFEDDVWELYHVAEDFSESKNLAEEFPEKLEELKKIFEEEAWANQVYPLYDDMLGRLNAVNYVLFGDKKEFTYYAPGAVRIAEKASVPVKGRSHKFETTIDLKGDEEGVNVSCGGEQTTNINNVEGSNTTLKVFTVNYPLFYFTKRIGGEYVELIYPIPANVDPAYWQPQNSLIEIQKVDLILANGAGYAKWKEKVSLPSSKIVNTSEGFSDKFIEIRAGPTHSHGGAGEHSHIDIAFTTWLDFKLANEQATKVRDALVKLLPEKEPELNQNFNELKGELESLDERMESLSADLKKETFIGSHPVYQYLSRGYNLDIRAFHLEPNEMPTEDQWQELEKLVKDKQITFMIWEGPPMIEITTRLNEMKLKIVILDPCGNKPDIGDFMSVMANNLRQLELV